MWWNRPPPARAIRRSWLTDVITQIWEQSRRTYGWRRVQAELAHAHDHMANKKLVRVIMREQGIGGLPKRRKGGRNSINKATSTNLLNHDFNRDGPSMLWMTDIIKHLTREGRVSCCVVLDARSRKLVDWSIDQRPTTAMVNSVLGMAGAARRPQQEERCIPITRRNTPPGPSSRGSALRTSCSLSARSSMRPTIRRSHRSGVGYRPNFSAPRGGPHALSL
jgi:transposase InsO family protein